MKFKEIRVRTGELVAYSDENGAVHPLTAIYKKDVDGKETSEIRDDVEIIPMTEVEVDQVKAKVAEMESTEAANQYKLDRAKEYPDFKEYLDGVVKGDQAQIDAYIAACQTVKTKYPKL